MNVIKKLISIKKALIMIFHYKKLKQFITNLQIKMKMDEY